MKTIDNIKRLFSRRNAVLIDNRAMSYFGDYKRRDYSSLIWINICDLLTDLINDITLVRVSGDLYVYSMFKTFVEVWGKNVLQMLFDNGFVVVGYDGLRFWIMSTNEYRVLSKHDSSVVEPINPQHQVYVLRSSTWLSGKMSDRVLCRPWLDYLDDVMNGSADIARRLGVCLVTSPKTAGSSPIATVLTEDDKKRIEADLQKDYGMLRTQSTVMVLPRDMNMQVINLAGQDVKMIEKCRQAILAICDRIKVPANQVSIIDANSSKSLSNGSELREGDLNKYKSFERLFNQTFMVMSEQIGLKLDYSVYNKGQNNG